MYTLAKKLERVQRAALIRIFGALRTTPTTAIYTWTLPTGALLRSAL